MIENVNRVSRTISDGTLNAEEALINLNKIDNRCSINKLIVICASGFAAGAFALLVGCGGFEFIIATLCCAVVQVISLFSKKTIMFYFFISFIGGFTPALFTTIISSLFKTVNVYIATIGAMLPLFPGAGIYKTIMEFIESNYEQAIKTWGDTFVNIALIATAVVLISIIFVKTPGKMFKKRGNLKATERKNINGKIIY